MKHLAFSVAACLLLASLLQPSAPAQSGRRSESSEKGFSLNLPAPTTEQSAAAVKTKEEDLYRCTEDGRAAQPEASEQDEPEGQIFSARDELTERAVITARPNPSVPEEARERGTSGTVRLRMVLAASGRVTLVKVLKGLPDGLTESAVRAACRIGFTPARKDGRAVSQWLTVEYNFLVDARPIFMPRRSPRWP